jgi:hypothetical protein
MQRNEAEETIEANPERFFADDPLAQLVFREHRKARKERSWDPREE